MNKRIAALIISIFCIASVLVICGSSNTTSSEHEPVTIQWPFRNTSQFLKLVKKKYPEIKLEVIPYNGQNMTSYLQDELKADDMPDIYFTTVYMPGHEDLSNRLIDLSGYSFTNRYAEARLADTSDNGALYLLPTYYTCIGITYNKTLLKKHGWKLPASFKELAPKVKAAGCRLAIDQLQFPGDGFQYACNIMETDYLNTIDGLKRQENFLNRETTVAYTAGMQEAFEYLDKWRDIGMLNGDGDIRSDDKTKRIMAEGNTLFMLGSSTVFDDNDTDDEFGIMPYLSEDGSHNAFILNVSRYVGLNKHLEDRGNSQKLEDAVHVMEVMSTVEGMTALDSEVVDTSMLTLKDYRLPKNSYYKGIENQLNEGITAPFIYYGWENMIAPIGDKMIKYIQGKASLEEVKRVFDDSQHLIEDNKENVYTEVAEKLETTDCARLVGIAFGKAAGADLAMISTNKWYSLKEGYDLNLEGVSGALFPLPVTNQQITSILPTGWNGTIQTVELTGKCIKELAKEGYNRNNDGKTFPYVVAMPENFELEENKIYTVAICGVTDKIAKEGKIKDTGVVGLTAVVKYVSRFDRLTKKDLIWG